MLWGMLILYILFFIGSLATAYNHGKPRKNNDNIFIYLLSGLLQLVLTWWALGWRFI